MVIEIDFSGNQMRIANNYAFQRDIQKSEMTYNDQFIIETE